MDSLYILGWSKPQIADGPEETFAGHIHNEAIDHVLSQNEGSDPPWGGEQRCRCQDKKS